MMVQTALDGNEASPGVSDNITPTKSLFYVRISLCKLSESLVELQVRNACSLLILQAMRQ